MGKCKPSLCSSFSHSHLSPDQDQPLEDELPSLSEDFNDSGLWRPENEPSLPGVEEEDPPVTQTPLTQTPLTQTPVTKTPVNKRLILAADTPACTPLPDYEVILINTLARQKYRAQ